MYKILNARFRSATQDTYISPVFTGNPQELTQLLPHFDPEELNHGGTQQELLSLNSSRILRRISLVRENEFAIKQYNFTETGHFDVDFYHIIKALKLKNKQRLNLSM